MPSSASTRPPVTRCGRVSSAAAAARTAASVKIDKAGNAYVVGGTRAALPGQKNIGDFDSFIVKFDPSGADVWVRQFGTTIEDYALTVSLDGAGNPVVAGRDRRAPGRGLRRRRPQQVHSIQYDTAGEVMWTAPFGSPLDDYAAWATAIGPCGDMFIVGSTAPARFPATSPEGEADAYIMAFNGQGNGLWSRQFGTSGVDDAEAISFDAAGKPFIGPGGPEGRYGAPTPAEARTPSWPPPARRVTSCGSTGSGGPAEDFAMALAVSEGEVYVAGGTAGALPARRTSPTATPSWSTSGRFSPVQVEAPEDASCSCPDRRRSRGRWPPRGDAVPEDDAQVQSISIRFRPAAAEEVDRHVLGLVEDRDRAVTEVQHEELAAVGPVSVGRRARDSHGAFR